MPTVAQLIAKYRNDPRFSQLSAVESMIPDKDMSVDAWSKKHPDLLNHPMMPQAVREVIATESKPKAPSTKVAAKADGQKTLLFLHGMESRYGKVKPEKIEADARKYAESKGMKFEAIPISGDKRQAQLAAAQKRLGKGDIGAVLGFSAGGYTAAKLNTPKGVEKIIVGAPKARGNQELPGRHMDQVAGLTQKAAQNTAPPKDVGDARQYLARTATPAGTMARQGVDAAIGRLHPVFAERLKDGIAALRANGYPEAGIASAFRSGAGKYGTGSRFDVAGQSLHSIGAAVDMTGIGSPGSRQAIRAHQILAQHGVYGAYGPYNRAEYNHFQLVPQKSVAALGGDPAMVRKMAGLGAPSDMSSLWGISKVPFQQPTQVAKANPLTPPGEMAPASRLPVVQVGYTPPQPKPQEKLFPPPSVGGPDYPVRDQMRPSPAPKANWPAPQLPGQSQQIRPDSVALPTYGDQPTTSMPAAPKPTPAPQPPGQPMQIRPDSVQMPVGGDAPMQPQPMQPPVGPGFSFGQGFMPAPPPMSSMPMPQMGGMGFGGGGGMSGEGMGGGGGFGGIGKAIASGAQTAMKMMPKPIQLSRPMSPDALGGSDFAQKLMQFLQG